ncbi:MAG: hypothetical protein R2831_00135 [Chitinophagaceae bacterium]
MKKELFIFLALVSICFLSACKKSPGFGGLASISGKVYAYDYTPGGNLEAEGYTGNINVYIKVEGENYVLKSVDTDYLGAFSFRELRKGTYTIWVYSYCDTCTGNQEVKKQTITIENTKDKKILSDFIINI